MLKKFLIKEWKKGLEKGISETKFYDDYFIRKNEVITLTVKYSLIIVWLRHERSNNMNQKKIGRSIAECRKIKELTKL